MIRKYESVPLGTLLTCLAAWYELKYTIEYRAKEKARYDVGLSWNIMLQAGKLAIDIQDVEEEIIIRNVRIFYDLNTGDYTTKK